MFKYSAIVLALVGTALSGSLANAECKIYADPDFKGKEGIVKNDDLVRFNPEGTHDTVLVPRKVREFRDASWQNLVSSVKVSDECEAVFWNAKGQHGRFRTLSQLPPDYDNPSLGVLCECKAKPGDKK